MRLVVETASGRLRGEQGDGAILFRGVPFARPPVGALRFRPPEPPEPWPGVREASDPGPSAPQGGAAPGFVGPVARWLNGGDRRSEDCLRLQIWTPGLDGARRPVLVWIHGGAFMMGSGSMPLYSGRRLARRGDVVVVNVNYRLGALGFLHLGLLGEVAPGASNLGIRDQVAALRWVREHIASFGGDPGNVTIFGESAGAMSVATLLGVPEARPLFHRAVAQSGAAHNVSGPERGARVAELFLRKLGVAGPGELAQVPAPRILEAQTATTLELGIGHGTLPWQPVVDGEWIPEQPLEAIAAGRASDVPLLIGTNRDEWKLFTALDRSTRAMDEAMLRRRLARVLPGVDARGAPLAERALETYRGGRADAGPLELWEAIQTDRIFRYPALRLAELHAARQPSTFVYQFTWRPWLAPRRVGACHAIEIPFVFGTLRHPLVRPVLGSSRGARALSRAMQESWLAFARGGVPASPALPAWPRYEAGERATLILGRRSEPSLAPGEVERRFWEPHLGNPTA